MRRCVRLSYLSFDRSNDCRVFHRVQSGKTAVSGLGRPSKFSTHVIKEVREINAGLPVGYGHDLLSFERDLQQQHKQEVIRNKPESVLELIPDVTVSSATLGRLFKEALPEAAKTWSMQTAARDKSVRNGCSAISHATAVNTMAPVINPSLRSNEDSVNVLLNAARVRTQRNVEGAREKQKQSNTGPKVLQAKQQKRTADIYTMGTMHSIEQVTVHLTDHAVPLGQEMRLVFSKMAGWSCGLPIPASRNWTSLACASTKMFTPAYQPCKCR